MQLEIWPPWCWLVWSVSWALKWSCLPLSPIVSGCLPLCGGWGVVGVAAFLGSEVVLSPVVSGCLPSCGGWVLVGVAASRTKIFRNQNHRFQSKFAYCKLFGVYAGVITFDPSVWLRLSRCLNQLNIWWWKTWAFLHSSDPPPNVLGQLLKVRVQVMAWMPGIPQAPWESRSFHF